MLSKIRNKKGFTLIELMIVVAIIAILAAIAIPNFLKFQAKSKQSEARTMLTGVYEAQMGFFSTQNYFSHTASVIGFEPASVPKYYVNPADTGWISSGGVTSGPGGGNHFTSTTSANIDRDDFRDGWVETDDSREPLNIAPATVTRDYSADPGTQVTGPTGDDVSN
jgi:prepilin-type N-terminal cleavage/methylation domain-containing protein